MMQAEKLLEASLSIGGKETRPAATAEGQQSQALEQAGKMTKDPSGSGNVKAKDADKS